MRCCFILAAGLLVTTGEVCAQGGASVVLTAGGMPTPGSGFTVTATPLKSGLSLGVLVELNGVHLSGVTLATKTDGSIDIGIPIPAAASGGSITVTVTTGGIPTSFSAPIMP